MRLSATNILNSFAIAGVGGMVLYGAISSNNVPPMGVDTMTTASIVAVDNANGDQFVAIDHLQNASCIIKLHRAVGHDVHRIEPDIGCSDIQSNLGAARAWQETAGGTVTISDHKGNALMRLSRADGFAWEVIEPASVQMSLSAF